MGHRRPRLRPEDDLGAGALGQLAVAAHEVGVEVGLDDVADAQALGFRLGQVLLDVAAWVDDRGLTLGADQVGGVSQAAQVELLEVHGGFPGDSKGSWARKSKNLPHSGGNGPLQ